MAKAQLQDRVKSYEETKTRLRYALEACPKDSATADAIRDSLRTADEAIKNCRCKIDEEDEEDEE